MTALPPNVTHAIGEAALNPYELLKEHPDICLVFTRLPGGQRGRLYPDLDVIMIDERLSQAERRCTLMHELVHRMRGDTHVEDDVLYARQERACHETVARLLIPFDRLQAAMQWGRDAEEVAQELWVDLTTLHARIASLNPAELERLRVFEENEAWGVA